MTGPLNLLYRPGGMTVDPVRQTWQEVRERSAGITRNEANVANVRVPFLSENTGFGTRLLREIDHDVIANRATDPREITESVETAVSLL